ncbi:LacI family DNA-binding transcriptional regulator [Sphingomonas sp. 1P08PE]|uniref:LacI family DNA-binding transcriptional regulator n=1 Tax=Sphingomonas sp. 1P08PE TaxID=554122 RepID=UPI0039A3A209
MAKSGKKSDTDMGTAAPIAFGGIRRATSYDVAKLAGVSQSAVSRCFAPGGSIAPATREKVMKAATELGYRPNALAQALITRRTNLVAVFISRLTNLHYPEVLAELSRQLTDRDIRVLLFALTAESEIDQLLEQVWRHDVDGIISAARLDDEQIAGIRRHGIPIVLYNRTAGEHLTPSVWCDSAAGERELVDRLLAAGHRRFAIVAGPADSAVGEERRLATLARLAEAGIHDVPVTRGDFSYASGRDAVATLARASTHTDAFVCVSDVMAIGAIDGCRFDLGLKVPEDVSVVGFDGSEPAGWMSYQVTSIRQPVRRMTAAAVQMLMERIEDPNLPAERRSFVGAFVPGQSARV